MARSLMGALRGAPPIVWWLGGAVIVVVLAAVVFVNIVGGSSNSASIGRNGGSLSASGLTLNIPQGTLQKDVRFTVEKKPSIGSGVPTPPTDLKAVSAAYGLKTEPKDAAISAAKVTVELTERVQPSSPLDLFSWEANKWVWIGAAQADATGLKAEGELDGLPSGLAVAQSQNTPRTIAGWLSQETQLDPTTVDALDIASPVSYAVRPDGTLLETTFATPKKGGLRVIPAIQNKNEGKYDGKLLDEVLSSDAARRRHVEILVNLASVRGYAGLELDYQGLDPNKRENFARFVSELAEDLHAGGKSLAVSIPLPVGGNPSWDTGAYEWRRIGRSADFVRVLPERDQSKYFTVMDEVLRFATSQVDRRKLQLVVTNQSHESGPSGIKQVSLQEALALATKIEVKGQTPLGPGNTVTLLAPNLLADTGASGLYWDDGARSVTFTFQGQDGARTVWITNSFSVAHKLILAGKHNLKGIAVDSLTNGPGDRAIWQVVATYKQGKPLEPAKPGDIGLTWETGDGKVLSTHQGWTNWEIPSDPGNYEAFALAYDGVSRVGSSFSYNVVPQPTPTPAPAPKPAPQPAPAPAPAPAPKPTPPPVVAPPPSGVRYPGVGYGMQVDPGNDLNRSLGMIRNAGFGWVKIQLRWEFMESSKGNINWGAIDNYVNTAAANGVRLLFSVVTAPGWSRPADTDRNVPGPPANPQDFADFVGAIAARHKGKVHAYEVWNEQNLWYEWGGTGRVNAAQYVELLKRAYAAIKAADPGAVVLSGAPTPTGVNDGNIAIDDLTYVQQMYAAGAKPYFDALAAHPSGYNNSPDDWPGSYTCCGTQFKGHPSFYYRRFEQFREVMVANGDSGKQIWFTEFGWASLPDPYPEYAYAKDISEQTQADFLVRAFQYAKAKGYVGPMFIWNLNYAPIAEANDRYGKRAFSIIHSDWSPRPAYGALAAMPK